ncbi:transposase [Dechloromonas sp. A34]|uniref:transposase n=1 Tax=Dechloromonas sp. A34 TaxID=447588 RepID=UPI002249408E|nr:transposase [Dechloromonas sp. A34]
MEVKKPSRRRRTHPEEFKQAVIAACCEAGASVAGIALANSVNANQVRRWMRERGIEPPSRSLPARSISPARGTEPAFVPVPMPPIVSSIPDIRIEVRRGNTAVKIEWPGQAASDCAAWLRDWLR